MRHIEGKSKLKIKSNYDVKKSFQIRKETLLLDFLLANMAGQSRNNIKALLKNNQVIINGAPMRQFDYLLHPGDALDILKNRHFEPMTTKLDIIYEDEELIAINKPCNLLTIASDKEKSKTAFQEVFSYLKLRDLRARPFIVHRLDKGTSGVLLFAKNPKIAKALQDNWNELVSKRRYVAIVTGRMEKSREHLEMYLKENDFNLMYVTKDTYNGKKSILDYEVKKANDDYSYLDVSIESGRKNQIRVMLGSLNHFVVGDDKYGNPPNPLKRLGLHANELIVKHPSKKTKMVFRAKIPEIFDSLFVGKKVK